MSFIFKKPPALPRSARPIVRITETFGGSASSADKNANALVLDARKARTVSDLTWLYESAQRHADSSAFRKAGGRIVVLRPCPSQLNKDIAALTATEAMVGFAMSLAKENGGRGATVNLIRDSTPGSDASDKTMADPLDWLLSHGSSYVTGQELILTDSLKSGSSSENGAILVTGAAGGIGKATVEFLDKNKDSHPCSKLLLLDHPATEPKLKQIADSLSIETETLGLDITTAEAKSTITDAAMGMGGFERVIHAAGITRDKTIKNMDFDKQWNPVMKVNLESNMDIDQALLNVDGALMKNSPSSFVYFSSTSGVSGNAGQSNYAATKAGLLGYTKAVAESNPNHAFRVISPGFIATDMTQKMPWMVRTIASKLNAMGQAGAPEDVAAAVAYLTSPESHCLEPGFHLRVCGLFMGGR